MLLFPITDTPLLNTSPDTPLLNTPPSRLLKHNSGTVVIMAQKILEFPQKDCSEKGQIFMTPFNELKDDGIEP